MSRPYIRQEMLEVALFKTMFQIFYFLFLFVKDQCTWRQHDVSIMFQDKFGSFWTVIAVNFLNEYQKQCYEVMQSVIFSFHIS